MTKFYNEEYRDRIYAKGTDIDEMLHLARMHLEEANHLKTFEDIAFEIHQSVEMGKKLIEVLREKRYNDPRIQGIQK